MKFATIGSVFLLAAGAAAQSGPYGQCGGNGWTGSKTCVSGYVCNAYNEWYSQCIPGTAQPTTTTRTTTTSVRTTVTTPRTTSTTVRTTTTTPRPTTTSTRTTTVPPPTQTGTPGVTFIGRVDQSNPAEPKFAWSGSGFLATISGSTIAIRIRSDGAQYYYAVVDGVAKRLGPVSNSASGVVLTLAEGLSAGDHKVEFYRDNEAHEGVTTFLGVTSGTLRTPPSIPTRRVEIVGDSISAGYGNLGSEDHSKGQSCTYAASTSSWYLTYGALAGRALNAQVTTVARSGWGIIRGYGGDATALVPSIYPKYLGPFGGKTWDYKPSVNAVVINLGTNDWSVGDPGTQYETAYVQFLKQIRAGYPNAHIFLTIGSLLGEPSLTQAKTRLANVIQASGDVNVSTFDYGTQDGSVTGCDYHPSLAEHRRMAVILQGKLAAKLGW
ncbi:hypothetical protein HK097_002666 [Rhizophlyctis rosea]|uniref:CBM1 domain-containing protein n=1 Tax=Rhizophlyctis rosea TaxID=64517 RepID=A0AAD5S4Z7_9FUNG|nr:hypothetical protein HK097_002666 [Rhizophlyctis rosea]